MSDLVDKISRSTGHTYPSAKSELVISDTKSNVFRAELHSRGLSASPAISESISEDLQLIECDCEGLMAISYGVCEDFSIAL